MFDAPSVWCCPTGQRTVLPPFLPFAQESLVELLPTVHHGFPSSNSPAWVFCFAANGANHHISSAGSRQLARFTRPSCFPNIDLIGIVL